MKVIPFTYLAFCLVLAQAPAQGVKNSADAVQPSPDFAFITLEGKPIRSADLKGRVIVLDFWSTDCTPCRRSMPQLQDFYQRYKNDPRVAFYLVNSGWESIDKARAFAGSKRSGFLFLSWGPKYDLPFAYDSGSVTLKALGFDANPSTVIIDAHARIRLKHSGYIEKLNDYLTEHVESYLAER